MPENILRLPSFLRSTTAEREGLAALAAQAAAPSAIVRSITAEMQVGLGAGLGLGEAACAVRFGPCLYSAESTRSFSCGVAGRTCMHAQVHRA